MDFRKGLPKDPKFQRKYASLEMYMRNVEKGDVQFLEVQSYPLVSMTFTSGELKEESDKRECHLNVIMEKDGFPRSPEGKYKTEKHGPLMHCDRIKKEGSGFKLQGQAYELESI
jgi:hypothetical protein